MTRIKALMLSGFVDDRNRLKWFLVVPIWFLKYTSVSSDVLHRSVSGLGYSWVQINSSVDLDARRAAQRTDLRS